MPSIRQRFHLSPCSDFRSHFFYLTEKEGNKQFSAEDEVTLMMFASQAAAVIANSKQYEHELRARANLEIEKLRLEAVIEASPVGILVVDAETGVVVSVNREAERMFGIPPEQGTKLGSYQGAATYYRADGRELPVHELPLSRALSRGETVRAEEIIFHVPDGRKITTLVNATPIHSESGAIESAVAVIQDMTPLEEVERQRSNFLGMVSHELRAPLSAIKGSSATVLESLAPFDAAEMRQFFRIIDKEADHLRELINSLLDITRIEAGMLSITPEPVAVIALVDQAKPESTEGRLEESGRGVRELQGK